MVSLLLCVLGAHSYGTLFGLVGAKCGRSELLSLALNFSIMYPSGQVSCLLGGGTPGRTDPPLCPSVEVPVGINWKSTGFPKDWAATDDCELREP